MKVSAQNPVLIIVHGRPATGKTTIARHLAERLNIPLITKDDIKELLFDSLGWSDRAWSRKLGGATYPILMYVAESFLKAGRSLMLESNFPFESNHEIQVLAKRTPFQAVQVICQADAQTISLRFERRQEDGTRHPGHAAPDLIDEMRRGQHISRTVPLELLGEVLEVDTNDFQSIDLDSVVERLSLILGPRDATEAKTPEQ